MQALIEEPLYPRVYAETMPANDAVVGQVKYFFRMGGPQASTNAAEFDLFTRLTRLIPFRWLVYPMRYDQLDRVGEVVEGFGG